MDGLIFDKHGKQIGYVKQGFACDLKGKRIFRRDGVNLRNLITGEVVCHLTPAGVANTPGHEQEGDASRHFEVK